MENEFFVAVVVLEQKKYKGIDSFHINEDGKVEVMLIDKTTAKDRKNGKNSYGFSIKSGLVFNRELYNARESEIKRFLNKKFKKTWVLQLKEISSK